MTIEEMIKIWPKLDALQMSAFSFHYMEQLLAVAKAAKQFQGQFHGVTAEKLDKALEELEKDGD